MRHLLSFSVLALAATGVTARGAIADFTDLSLPTSNSFHNNGSFSSHGITFSNTYDTTYDSWNGFSFSNVSDNTTAGFGNQYASFAGGGAPDGGNIYAVAYPDAVIDLPAGQKPVSVDLTNTTYAGLSMANGDQFAKKFGGASGNDPDYFTVTLVGYTGADATGTVTGAKTFFLADYRFADNSKDYIVNTWTPVDLSALGGASSIGLSFDSSDFSTYGGVNYPNTPTYVALDDLTTAPVPEPTSLGLMAVTGVMGLSRRRRIEGHS